MLKDGAYSEESQKLGFRSDGKLVGNRMRYHLHVCNVECDGVYFTYTPSFEAYVRGMPERDLPQPLPHDENAARLVLVEKGSSEAVIFEHAQALAQGEAFVPLTLKGRGDQAAIVVTEPHPKSVQAHGAHFKLLTASVGTAKAAVHARLDPEGGHLTMESNGFILDVNE